MCLWLACCAASAGAGAFDWQAMPSGRWVNVPTRGVAAPKVFHGGAAIAPDRGEVFFFGSDTHEPAPPERGESNALWRLSLSTLRWQQDYPQDPKTAYRILADGQCVTSSGRPWAMHTFDAVEYDPEARRVVVISFPEHTRFAPDARFPMFRGDWYTRLKPAHWEYDPDRRLWQRLDTGPPNLFAQALTWDPLGRQLIGHDGRYTYHFERGARRWSAREAPSDGAGWSRTIVYDTYARAALLFGKNGGDNTLYTYRPGDPRWRRVEVRGTTLPAEGAAIAYDSRNHVMVYLANRGKDPYYNESGAAVTFVYDSPTQTWQRLTIDSPPLYGMNYLMQYDPVRNVVLHFERDEDSADRLRVWAFRYR